MEEGKVAFQRYESKMIIRGEFKPHRRVETDPKGEASQNKSHSFQILSLILTKIDRIKNSFVSKTTNKRLNPETLSSPHSIIRFILNGKKTRVWKKETKREREKSQQTCKNKKKTEGKSRREKKARKTTEEEGEEREREKPRQKFTRRAKEQEGDILCVYADRKQGGLTREASSRPILVVVVIVVVATVVVAAYVNVAF